MPFITACILTSALFFSIGRVCAQDDYDYYYDAKSCALSESITGGTVKYSNGGAVGSEVTYQCKDGFKPYPVFKKVCSSNGEWEPKVARVKCEEEGDYEDYEEPQKNCSLAQFIKGGRVSYSKEGLEGSMLTYHCEAGFYPFPTKLRVCESSGEWSTMVLPNGKAVSTATCKEVLCPAQLQLDNGEFRPRKQWFKVGEGQAFSCREGYTLLGSAWRNCTEWGHWTGTTPVCDDQTDDCKNPVTPPGAMRSGERFRIGDTVKYSCQAGLDLLGPDVRVCLDAREWSGPSPRCQAHHTFDLPAAAAQAMSGSLSALMDVSSPEFKKKDPGYGRTLRVADGRLNIFILLDTSGSISEYHFEKAKQATANLIQKLGSYDVIMKFDIISYASEPQDIITITNSNSDNIDFVLNKLMEFKYTRHGKKTGTNLFKAISEVYGRLAFLKVNKESHFNETQNVILIETDGFSNMGANPQYALNRIRDLFGYKSPSIDHTGEELLDVYVFGIGENVKRNELKTIASSKNREQHLFLLSSYTDLGEVFNNMINDSAVIKCGVAQEVVHARVDNLDTGPPAHTRPWHVTITWRAKPCQGSILTENWVITAAHCLIKLNNGTVETAAPRDVTIKHGAGTVGTSFLTLHPQFDIKGLKDKNVNEFYDYDVALVRVNGIELSSKARPICLPCTKASNRALRMSPDSTCKQHESSLFHLKETQAYFIQQGKNRKQTHIHTGEKRADCIEQYGPALSSNKLVSLTDVVTDRFLCTGGSAAHRDGLTCKGDSGGSLFLRKGMRYFQVGVVSWGTKLLCDSSTKHIPEPPEDGRDFHISLFSIMPWLKEHLAPELDFLPLER
ncbi:complement factor B [Electrophorus electricus]|uniref:complement factor B n=1 Tax=Electrophorus electricus TaxID=8005 RepID=UPI0015D00F1F|nr:complement factor B [Electrophorus electricus]